MSAPTPGRRSRSLLAVVALLVAGCGVLLLVRADAGLAVHRATVAGVPLTEVRAAHQENGTRRPAVLIAHGFAGSARLMRPLADSVARHGAVAVLLDFAGHGANPARLPGAGRDDGRARDALRHDLDVALGWLRTRPDVDPARIVLVGHSMGAGAVTRYAVDHPELAGTVAISLPDAGDLPYGRPRSLTLVVGGLEFADFHRAAEEALRRAPDGSRGEVVVPGTEHISVLFAPLTHRTVLAAIPGPSSGPPPDPFSRLAGAGLLLLGAGLGFAPLATALLRPRRGGTVPAADPPGGTVPAADPPGRAGPAVDPPGATAPAADPAVEATTASGSGGGGASALRWLAVTGPATVLGVVAAALLPTARLPLAVGGYVAVFLLAGGALLVAARRWARPRRPVPAGAGAAVVAPVLVGYAVLAVAVPLHLGFTSAAPVGARWWLVPLVILCCLAFLLGAELVADGHGRRYAAAGGLAVLVLTGAAVLGLAPGFVLLVVPLFAALVAWQAAWAAVLRRRGAPWWLAPLVGAVLLGWPLATTLPLG
ncbi:alpha/beta fold hydrolase [Micromonospora auratinigra]|uniref:Alpha/beta hydrolase family protein n=1 Tax=Micromonospora auratinigra TaxID=261654 RepID=A0A1A9A9U6_9ACTN|nr:alpha/beta fold hydrolase [Micromonospora auratinigra]SBT52878.1 Alpha/beta hydrolase family protein [Micromonospora auratinigra]